MRAMIRALSLALVYLVYCKAGEPAQESAEVQDRVYFMKKCSGSGCPYTASWLAHTNLYKKIPWWLDSTKMEAASFNMYVRILAFLPAAALLCILSTSSIPL
jgi:hypothetical protein